MNAGPKFIIQMSQSVAHAGLSKLSGPALIHGPYSCMLPPIVYALIGTSRHGSVGTGSLVALLVGEFISQANIPPHEVSVETQVLCMTVITGAVLLLMRLFQLQALVKFISKAALTGFVNASAILIIQSQLRDVIGLRKPDSKPVGFVGKMLLLVQQLQERDFINPYYF